MAIKNEYILEFKSKGVQETKDGVDKLDKSTEKLGKTTKNKLSPAINKAKVAIAALGAAVVASATYSIKTAAEFEKLKTRLNTMYGSVNKGTKAFNTFNKIAATTPFALKNVVEAGASLKAFGVDAEDNIKAVSDLAAFMGVDIVEAASAMGRAFSGGAGAADVFRDRGVLNIIKMREGIDDLSKVTLPEFRVMMKEAFEDPTVGIQGATDALAETFTGRYSNMMDSVDRLADSMGQKLLPIAEKVVTFLGAVANEASGAKDAFDEQIISLETGQMRLGILVNNLQNVEQGSKQWKWQIQAIKKEYPDFLKGLEDEDINLQNINGRLKTYNELTTIKIANIELEQKKAVLQERQKNLITEQANAAQEYADNLISVDDKLGDLFSKAKDKTDMSTDAGLQFLSNLDSIRKGLSDEEQQYIDGKITIEEFYGAAINATNAFKNELNTAMEGGVYWNDILEKSGILIKDSALQLSAMNEYVDETKGLTDGLIESNRANNQAVKNTQAQFIALSNIIDETKEKIGAGLIREEGMDPEKNEIRQMTMFMEEALEIAPSYIESLEKIDTTYLSMPESSAQALKGMAKFNAGMTAIGTDLLAKDSALRNQVITSIGDVALASAGSKESQLKIQKFIVAGNVAKGVIDVWTEGGWDPVSIAKKVALSASLVAKGVTSSKNIDDQLASLRSEKSKGAPTANTKFAQYGMNEIVDQTTPIIAGEAGAELVQITPLEGPNTQGPQGGGSIVITGNVLSKDFVRDELVEDIREAIRQGYDFR
tara:strand:+ start:2838 stop:5147 length:2310 start_codon:yes stop_codon:yes gene_type:complete